VDLDIQPADPGRFLGWSSYAHSRKRRLYAGNAPRVIGVMMRHEQIGHVPALGIRGIDDRLSIGRVDRRRAA
jgi:hypothetical protein